jgi:hypothetical protein
MRHVVRVDEGKCRQVADLLRNISIPRPEEEGPLAGIAPDDLPNFYFLIVAICHQTSPLGKQALGGMLSSGEKRYGWDYLKARFAERVLENRLLLTPAQWQSFTPQLLDHLFVDALGNVTLSGAERRAELVRDLGLKCVESGITCIQQLYSRCDGWLIGGPANGLFAQLSQFVAFRDPLRKKSCLFLLLMREQCQWIYRDPSNLGTPVDYHEVRGHLRLGTVVVEDAELLARISQRKEVTEAQDLAIRGAVHGAVVLISRLHGKCEPSELHHINWNTFRNCCARDVQHCHFCGADCRLPPHYREAFKPVEETRCVFASVCNSAGSSQKLIEHFHNTDFY